MDELYSARLRRLFPKGIPEVINIGHRGAAAYYPENTLPSIQAAFRMGADMVELDVTLSTDRIPVVIHDDTLDRTTNGSGKVSELTVTQLKQLDAGSWMDSTFTKTQIPTLREALSWCKDRIPVNVEIKPTALLLDLPETVISIISEVIEELEMGSQVLISCFDQQVPAYIRSTHPSWATALLYERSVHSKKDVRNLIEKLQVDFFHCSQMEWLRVRKWSLPVPVMVYTVNGRRRMNRLKKQGVAGIFTDRPDRLSQI
jgi:glycerophosphoryl diester phosphodiesterase